MMGIYGRFLPSLHAIASGKVKGEDAMANALADWAASQAHTACGLVERETFLAYLSAKREAFIAMLIDINMLIITILEADSHRRKEKHALPKVQF